jgi:hypothetical protein
MAIFEATVKEIRNGEVSLEDIRNVFQELDVKTIGDFKQKKKSGIIKVPSFDNLNALCLLKKGQKFERFFFGDTELNKKKQLYLIDENLVERIKQWCIENNITTLNEYRQKGHPPEFPTYKSTVDNYGEDYFYEVLGLKKHKEDFSNKIFDDDFIKTLKDWCLKNNITSRNQYQNKKPDYFPSLERIRQLTIGSDYFLDFIQVNFETNRRKKEK